MKYRILTDEELVHFEQDLKAFLIINGIEGERWKELNETDPEKARALVALFSDQVLQTIYEKISFLEFRSKNSLLVFHCKPDEQELIAIHTKQENLDLSTTESIHEALRQHARDLEFFQSVKAYTASREQAIHELLEQGCILSDIGFWNALKSLL